MKYFNDHPILFRVLFLAAAILFLLLAVMSLHHSASFQTDENLFVTSPSRLYVAKSFPAQPVKTQAREEEALAALDSVLAGDLIVLVNRQEYDSLSQVQRLLAKLAPEAPLELYLTRPKTNRKMAFRSSKSALPEGCLREIPASVLIKEIYKDGASDRAGMLVGDLVLRINGQKFRDSGEADRIMRRAEAGRAIAYEVLRDNRVLTLRVNLARLGASLAAFLGILVGLSFWGLALFLGVSRPQIHAARILAAALLVLSFPLLMLLPRAPNPGFMVELAHTLKLLCLPLGFAVMLHSHAYFPKERPELLRRKWIMATPYLIAGLAFVFSFVRVRPFGEPLIFGLLALGLFALFVHVRFRAQCAVDYKKQNRVLKWAGLTASALSLVLALAVMRGAQDASRVGFFLFPLVLIPLAYLYTIGRYRIFDMSLRLGLNAQYLAISWFWGLLLFGGFVSSLFLLPGLPLAIPNFRLSGSYLEIVDDPLPLEQRLGAEKIVLMIFAIGLVYLYRRFHRTVQDFLSRKFHRAGYDYRRAVNELSELMATQLSMLDLAKGISRKLAEHIQLKRVGVLFFRDQKECCCQQAYGFDQEEWKEFCITIDQQLIETLQKFRSESRFSTEYLPPDLKEQFQRHGFAQILPIRFKEKLVGVLMIGEKLSEAGFQQEDLHYLTAVAKQASLAIENAFLYEELAEQERMKHELAIARRIQLASLPQTTPRISGLDIAGISIPALEVGGDYFDYLNGKPDQITVIVGDVSGKGTSAALYMSKVQGILRSLHDFGLSPRELFVRANHLLREALDRNSFVTSIGACFDASTKRLRLARAGHLPLYHYQARTGRIDKLTPKGLGLGLDDDRLFAAELEERSLSYETGDVFLFVTDGVTEAQSEHGGEFGEESLTEILGKSVGEPADCIRDRVVHAVKSFVNNEHQHDDLTLVVVKAV